MSCREGRKNHRWTRPHGYGLQVGAFKQDDDVCSWCGKTRLQVSLEKHRKSDSKRMNKDE